MNWITGFKALKSKGEKNKTKKQSSPVTGFPNAHGVYPCSSPSADGREKGVLPEPRWHCVLRQRPGHQCHQAGVLLLYWSGLGRPLWDLPLPCHPVRYIYQRIVQVNTHSTESYITVSYTCSEYWRVFKSIYWIVFEHWPKMWTLRNILYLLYVVWTVYSTLPGLFHSAEFHSLCPNGLGLYLDEGLLYSLPAYHGRYYIYNYIPTRWQW